MPHNVPSQNGSKQGLEMSPAWIFSRDTVPDSLSFYSRWSL